MRTPRPAPRLVVGLAVLSLASALAPTTGRAGLAEQCAWPPAGGSPVMPESHQTEATPMVADLDGDGVPEIVTISFVEGLDDGTGADGVLRILRGSDCSEVASVADVGCVTCVGDVACRSLDERDQAGFLCPECGVALGDLDRDGSVEIIAITEGVDFDGNGRRIVVFAADGTFLRCSPVPDSYIGYLTQPALVDLDANGGSEIVAHGNAFDSELAPLWSVEAGASGLTSIADVDGDGAQDLVIGERAHAAGGGLIWDRPDLRPARAVAIADFDLDCQPEVVLVAHKRAEVHVLDGATGVTLAFAVLPGGTAACPPATEGQGGSPFVADVDGDCVPEIGIAGCPSFVLYGWEAGALALRWTHPVDDHSSRATGATVFDLEGDGAFEVLYNDEQRLHVWDAASGALRETFTNTTFTLMEYPVVADVDADGQAEIVVAANDYVHCCNFGVRVLHDPDVAWAPARPLWNQHSYHVTNVADDATIPLVEEPSWLRHNAYRAQWTPGPRLDAPQLQGVPPDAVVGCAAPPPEPAPVSATDGCSGVVPTLTEETLSDDGCVRVVARTWTAVDACGRSDAATQRIVSRDTTPPVIEDAPADVDGGCDEEPAPAVLEAFDDCDDDVEIAYTQVESGTPCVRVLTRRWMAHDECGHGTGVQQRITLRDQDPPALDAAPDDLEIECGRLLPAPATLAATDDCDPDVPVTFVETEAGSGCDLTITRTWSATDRCGISATESQTVRVRDTSPPTLGAAPADIVLECGTPLPPPATLVASDACDPDVAVVFTEAETGSSCDRVVTRTWTATDDCGYSVSRTQRIEVRDTAPPTLASAPADVVIECGVPVPGPSTLTASDACDSSVAIVFEEVETGAACDRTLTRTWTATDDCGLVASTSQRVRIVDTRAPVLDAVPPDATIECGTPLPDPATPAARDACAGDVAVRLDETVTAGGCGGEAVHERTWTADDGCGHVVTATQVIRVVDATPPLVVPSQDPIACLWPPNHWYVCFDRSDLAPVALDSCPGAVTWAIAGCASDQPDDAREDDPSSPWNGDGHTTEDCVISPDGSQICVRSERCGTGPDAQLGRHYGIAIVAVDACGNASAPTVVGTLHVPHDQSPHERPCLNPTKVGLRPNQPLPF